MTIAGCEKELGMDIEDVVMTPNTSISYNTRLVPLDEWFVFAGYMSHATSTYPRKVTMK